MIFSSPKLPRISRILLVGYSPTFNQNIDVQISNNRLLVLGGNGLGKTTILQSIMYCIAGEADIDVEAIKIKRWGRGYFEGRISDLKEAFVQVEFSLGDDHVTLRRGFKTHSVMEFYLNGESKRGITSAELEFENYLRENAGYQSLVDFRFILHKLCYLPEDRSNLVWDSENQIRLMMLLFADLVNETEFKEKRKQLKQIDSKKRHKNVALNDAKEDLKNYVQSLSPPTPPIKENSEGSNTSNNDEEPVAVTPDEKGHDDEVGILRELSGLVRDKMPLQSSLKQLRKELNEITASVEELQNLLMENEEDFILEQLNRYESDEVKLAIHKLVHRQICPACGEKAEDLSNSALKYIQEKRCPLCGSQQGGIVDRSSFPLLDAQLSEKIRQKLANEKNILDKERALRSLLEKEEDLQFRLSKIKLNQSSTTDQETEDDEDEVDSTQKENTQSEGKVVLDTKNPLESLRSRVNELEKEYYELDCRFEALRSELESKYANFTRVAGERITRLGKLYEEYATAFLGLPCQLETRVADVKFLSLNLYVPKFDGKVREKPETCSEAQRFFLDIAFRMAVIDLAKELSQYTGSFICETPENALDVTYINNVANMFKRFSAEGHCLIATGNLQQGGLAGPILFDIQREQRGASVLNLLDYGRLSIVQQENLSALKGVLSDFVINFEGG